MASCEATFSTTSRTNSRTNDETEGRFMAHPKGSIRITLSYLAVFGRGEFYDC
jgi:hypothetical protein